MDPQKPKLRVLAGSYPATVPIDGYAIEVLITRMTRDQFSAFSSGFQRVTEPHSARLVSMRLPGEEQARIEEPEPATREQLAEYAEAVTLYKDGRLGSLLGAYTALRAGIGEFVIPDAEIRRRRLVEMTPEQRSEFERLHLEEEAFAEQFLTETISAHVRIVPGQIEVEDLATTAMHDVTEGAELVQLYGARLDVLFGLLHAILRKNTLSSDQKNASPSRSGSPTFSAAREGQAAPGERPAAPVPSADNAPSATTATATALTEDNPFGSTTPVSSSTPVLSVN